MVQASRIYATLGDWIDREAITFPLDDSELFAIAVDTMIAARGDGVELLGFGEALHGGEEVLLLRNRLFQRLVTAHRYSAIAIESSFPRYAVIGSAVGASEVNGIGLPEDGTLEARLLTAPGAATFIPTGRGDGLPVAEIAALPTRSGSGRNLSYLTLSPRSFTDFDWLAFLPSVTYWRGGRPLPD